MDKRPTKVKTPYERRAKIPQFARVAAVLLVCVGILVIAVGFYRGGRNANFRMKGFPASLSEEVVAQVEGYERRESEGNTVKYYIKADRAVTFSDNHQELENVFLQVFDAESGKADEMTAQKAVYVPGENKTFKAFFAGDVQIKTRDELTVNTENLTYDKAKEEATAEERIEFARGNIKGSSASAIVGTAAKRLELVGNVAIEALSSNDTNGQRLSKIDAGKAAYDQQNEKIELSENVRIVTTADGQSNGIRTAEISAGYGNVFLTGTGDENRDVQIVEFFEGVKVHTVATDGKVSNMNAGYVKYDKPRERFDLNGSVFIATSAGDEPTTIRAQNAVYDKNGLSVALSGAAEILQTDQFVKGDAINADLYPTEKIKNAVVRGNGYVSKTTAERKSEVIGPEINVAFSPSNLITAANVVGAGTTIVTPTDPAEYSKFQLHAPVAIRVAFANGGPSSVKTDGRTTLDLSVPDNAPDSANKKVTADSVTTDFFPGGRSISKASAVGNAVLEIIPLRQAPANYTTTVKAPRFDCVFFDTGNNVRACDATGGTNTTRVPTVARDGRGDQTMTSQRIDVAFGAGSRYVEKFSASGRAKFTELDRNASAERFDFTSADGMVRLRNGEPTVWDSRARGKATTIDWDTNNDRSFLRGGVRTTYYSQRSTGGAAPFGSTDKPVYVTAETAEFDHRAETGRYTGDARAWQENNYVRANTLLIRQKEGQFFGEGAVQSLLYEAKAIGGSNGATQPVHAASERMSYDRNQNKLRYEGSVDIRQGNDRLKGGVANILLSGDNEVRQTEIEQNVVITQPGRRATGEFALYNAVEEKVILRGRPATVEDSKSGRSSGAELTVFLRDNRVFGEGRAEGESSGRMRSVYKVAEQ